MIFDYYIPFYSSKNDKWVPGVKAQPLTLEKFKEIINCEGNKILIDDFRHSDKDAKLRLTAACWVGKAQNGKRMANEMKPTQYVMVDVDHCSNPRKAWEEVCENAIKEGATLAHVTPSGQGLRIVFKARKEYATLIEHMEHMNSVLGLEKYGDFDTAVKDFARISFLPYKDDVLYLDEGMFAENEGFEGPLMQGAIAPERTEKATEAEVELTDEQADEYKQYRYRGHLVSDIAKRYVEVYGEPEVGERHNFYNQMVKFFRCICDNNPLVLNSVLPKFGRSDSETLSQCQGICRSNHVGRLPREFFLFLLHNGFYDKRKVTDEEETTDDASSAVDDMPTLPPVFKEIVATAPRDFIIPCINALMPIMGTLTSYVRSYYPIDNEEHATSFFSIIYAPSGAGKSFVKRYCKMLLEDLELRDKLSDARDQIYNQTREVKSGNDRGPANPHVQLRLPEAKISETELLEKQQNNKGHHMFTFAAEIDQWSKGARAAGGNKDDMLRIAWDGGEYGQHYKSANSFKGKVNLYWNILMTGTEDQMIKYFKRNTANGLVQRCCFTEIPNQRFADINSWKSLTKKDIAVIEKFKARCDSRCYSQPLNFDVSTLQDIDAKDFDALVPWKYDFKPFIYLDMAFVWPTIKNFLMEQLDKAKMEQNDARDSWRKRSAVRGYRLAMICTQCWENIREREKRVICDFVKWWMEIDIEQSLKPFADTYNDSCGETYKRTKKSTLFDALDVEFSAEDLRIMCDRLSVHSKVYDIVWQWKKMGIIEQTEKKHYKKCDIKKTT